MRLVCKNKYILQICILLLIHLKISYGHVTMMLQCVLSKSENIPLYEHKTIIKIRKTNVDAL